MLKSTEFANELYAYLMNFTDTTFRFRTFDDNQTITQGVSKRTSKPLQINCCYNLNEWHTLLATLVRIYAWYTTMYRCLKNADD